MGLVRLPPVEHVKEVVNGLLQGLRPPGWRQGDPEAFEVWNDVDDVSLNDIDADVLVVVAQAGDDRDDGISPELVANAEIIEISMAAKSLPSGNAVFEAIYNVLKGDERRQQAPEFGGWDRVAEEDAITRSMVAFVVP